MELTWSTATETNNSGFEILCSTENEDWNKMGFVPGQGTTTETQHYCFTDNDVKPGKYQYRLKQIDYDGTFEYSQIVEVVIPFVNEFSLSQNYPNPFNPSTKIKYEIPASLNPSKGGTLVQLIVYDILGREIAVLVNEEKHPGNYEIEFDGSNLSSGIYLYRLTAGGFSATKKLVLLK
ncbi:MAG: T9SS type A sorting domain-containing protein [Ignavibacteriaceae bacterium]|nr:T9SS type A sorting domain-containing protein [Ignavibacteriaceae bacterium]